MRLSFGKLAVIAIGGGAIAIALAAWLISVVDQQRDYTRRISELTGGNAAYGPTLIVQYGCAGCHVIPGIGRARGKVGPSLAGLSERVYIGGMLNNTADNLVRWIVNPRAINAGTAMPASGISEDEARHVAAYLYSVR